MDKDTDGEIANRMRQTFGSILPIVHSMVIAFWNQTFFFVVVMRKRCMFPNIAHASNGNADLYFIQKKMNFKKKTFSI